MQYYWHFVQNNYFFVGATLCSIFAVYPLDTSNSPTSPPPTVTTKNIARHWQVFLEGQNHPWWRTADLKWPTITSAAQSPCLTTENTLDRMEQGKHNFHFQNQNHLKKKKYFTGCPDLSPRQFPSIFFFNLWIKC